ncbi:MAG: acetylornithine deacetylase [Rhodospirillaceae bacterium]|jgi:acetylornithine deacetylase|nr:acetylornithine deacetylase [Rhodospirillaceae bacterium]MBT6118662.1 acetylornithine deacetylase [Rhodospirillaceae bacterium]
MSSPSENSIEMIRRLVGFDTTSRDSNMPLIEWVRDYLVEHGVDSTVIRDDTGTKANLFATLGPQDRPGICLSGHTDVVPVDGQDWATDPFDLTEKDGLLYGRGTCDMKSFLAVALALVPEFQRRGLETPIHLAMSHDEEVGCRGVPRMLARMGDELIRPAMCIVGEPTSMKVVRGHKGKKAYRCDVYGLEAHSSLAPKAVNAIEYAAEIVAFLRAMARRKRDEGPLDDGYDIPHTTVQTGVIKGGTAINIVPRHCGFEFEFRVVPADDPDSCFEEARRFAAEELEPEMRAIHPDARIDFSLLSGYPGLDTDEGDPVVALAKQLTGANSTDKVAFGTEAGLFQQAEIPTVVCGPGSIDQAHKPNEFVSLDQIALCEQLMKRLMEHVCRN